MTVDFERHVALEGAYNLRDIGGYRVASGGAVRRGRLFRSAALGGLTVADIAAVEALGVELVVDLRTSRERRAQPNRGDWTTWSRDYDTSTAELGRVLSDPALTQDRARAAMMVTYDRIPEEQADAYAELFRRIAAGDLPLLFHCAVGKDRTGVAAALILDLLGVDRATISDDYLLTNRAQDRVAADALVSLRRHNDTLELALLAPVVRADAAYLDAMFAGIETRHGSTESYVIERLGLPADAVDAIRVGLTTHE